MLSGAPLRVEVEFNANGQALPGIDETLFQTNLFNLTALVHEYAVHPDGDRFLMNTLLEAAPAPMTIIFNWNPDAE